jgi:hypothetical protein
MQSHQKDPRLQCITPRTAPEKEELVDCPKDAITCESGRLVASSKGGVPGCPTWHWTNTVCCRSWWGSI